MTLQQTSALIEGISPKKRCHPWFGGYLRTMDTIRKTRSITFSAAPDMDTELRRISADEGVPNARIVDSLLRSGLKQQGIASAEKKFLPGSNGFSTGGLSARCSERMARC